MNKYASVPPAMDMPAAQVEILIERGGIEGLKRTEAKLQ